MADIVLGNGYTNGYLYQGNIYVHLSSAHIGMANGSKKGTSQEQAISSFRQAKNLAFLASKTQYKRLFFSSLNQNSQILLNEVLKNDQNDEIFRQLQKQIGIKMEQALSSMKMGKLLQISKKSPNILIEQSVSQSKKEIENFNNLLKSFKQAANLLRGSTGKNLMLALCENNFSGANRRDMGQYLLKIINDFKQKNNKVELTTLEIQQAQQIVQTFNALGNALSTNLTSSKENITTKSIQLMISAIFNTGFAESLSAELQRTASIALSNAFKAKMTGSNQVRIEYTDATGLVSGYSDQASYGKADAIFENVQVHSSVANSTITLDIGISDKLYKANAVQKLGKKVTGVYGSGSGGSLREALNSTFHSVDMQYLAINTIGHGQKGDWSQAQMALNEVLLTRQIVRLFSSRGGSQDFAQYMFVNGRIVPIYEIIMSTLQNIQLSESLGGSKSQPVTLSIEGRDKIQNQTHDKEKNLEQRIKDIHAAINRAKIKAHVNMNFINFENIV